MHLHLMRMSTGAESTVGSLYINGVFACFTLEDTKRIKKIDGQTRIPDGRYQIQLRTEGGLTKQYKARYGRMHKGMLWLQDVPDFQWVYIHTGNKRGHTEGCILVGDGLNNNQIGEGPVSASRPAYQRIYPLITKAILAGEETTLRLSNFG